jgi:hypothetical protein
MRLLTGYAALCVLAAAVFLLALQAKRSQYPDALNGDPHLSQSAKMDKRAQRGADSVPPCTSSRFETAPLAALPEESLPESSQAAPEPSPFPLPYHFRPPPSV